MSESVAVRPVRRVVTGHDAGGTAKILVDDLLLGTERDGRFRAHIWSSGTLPADIALGQALPDQTSEAQPFSHAGGAHFLVFDFAPKNTIAIHRTETLDYAIVLEGEIDLDLEGSSTTLHAGDVLVQRGTNHSWKNRSERTARVAFVMIPARPLGISPSTTRGEDQPGGQHAPS